MIRRTLHDGWQLEPVGPTTLPPRIPATVPGCVHTDLLAAGLIPDPYVGGNEAAVQWIGWRQWRYRTVFDWHPGPEQHHELAFDGLDTVASIRLNGTLLGRTANMHRRYRFDVGALLRPGGNELVVEFDSAEQVARAERDRLGDLPGAYPTPFPFLRKAACHFGWDWGPALVTAGIWRAVRLESWSGARITRLLPTTTIDGADGVLRLRVEVSGDPARLQARLGDTVVPLTARAGGHEGELRVPDAELWWPHSMGAQPRYDLTVTADDDEQRRRVGFRSIELDTSADEIGSACTFVVNGRPMFVRGANWIPDDCFPSRVTRDRLARRIDQAVGAHVDLLRVWGGGCYESDDFYDLCDERGVLVWQDFLFACAAYPEAEPLRSEIEAEAADNVERLAARPALAVWCGCNENLWGHEDWGWKEQLGDRPWGAGYYFDLLPRVLAELDPDRPYLPGSPWSPGDRHPNDPDAGVSHSWAVWNEKDYTAYADTVPRFLAEFGYQGPPTATTAARADADSHQKAIDGALKLERGAAPHLPVGGDADERRYLLQVQQAEAVRFGIEHLRAHRGRNMGAVLWQLNDCWPVTSWSAVDGDGRRKLLWYALRDAYADRLLAFVPGARPPQLFSVDETDPGAAATARVQRVDVDGTVLAGTELVVAATPVAVPDEVATPGDPRREFLVAQATDGRRALHFFVPAKDLPAADPGLDERRWWDGDVLVLELSARRLARHVAVLADRLGPAAVADRALFDLVAGERVSVRISGVEFGEQRAVWFLPPPVA